MAESNGRNVRLINPLGNLLFGLPEEVKKIIRQYEKSCIKINSLELAVIFNKTCIREGILPKYTNLRLHDPTARRAPATAAFRRTLIHRQLEEKQQELLRQKEEQHALQTRWFVLQEPDDRQPIEAALKDVIERDYNRKAATIQRKIVRCNGGFLRIPQRSRRSYINLTDYHPTPEEEEVLQLGLNCHVVESPKDMDKRIEIESLLESIFSLEDKGAVTTTDELQPLLLAEALQDRGNYRSRILNPRLRKAAKDLRQNNDVVIRRADKTAAFVLISKEEYLSKLDNILQDPLKFQRVRRNPIEDIKREVNSIIDGVNALNGAIHLPRICGDYDVGYIYGNVKTHKPGNPLRPIISQCPTPTYQLAKALNKILTPYIPDEYCLKSSTEFLQAIAAAPSEGVMASLDVESLFTNVPVDETIDLLLDHIYRNNDTPQLNIPENSLRRLLQICTKEAPFRDQRGNLWKQIDGVAMGSPLGVLFANTYMGFVEQRVFQLIPQPTIYRRYIDDTFVVATTREALELLQQTFVQCSVLRFTCEFPQEDTLPFLDVRITQNRDRLSTTVYRKPTNIGLCLNGDSECPTKFKSSVIYAYVRRALTHCSTWSEVHKELDFVAQQLVNNGYSNKDIQRVTRRVLDQWYSQPDRPDDGGRKIKVFYRNFMHPNYKKDEAALREIINNNVSVTDPDSVLNLIIYYRNKKTSQMLMRNSPKTDSDPLKKHGVVYRILCPANGCSHSYIGMTTTKLSKRLAVHLQEGNFFQHFERNHGALERPLLLKSTSIIDKDTDRRRLRLREALHILHLKPTLNVTQETLLLPTTIRRNRPTTNNDPAVVGIPVRGPEEPVINHNEEIPAGAPANPPAPGPPAPPRRSARLRQRDADHRPIIMQNGQ